MPSYFPLFPPPPRPRPPRQTWELRGRYPNRGYPKIFKDETVGEEARKLFDDAQKMLQQIVAEKTLQLTGIVGMYPAARVGEDIEVYADESRRGPPHSTSCFFFFYLFVRCSRCCFGLIRLVKSKGGPTIVHFCVASYYSSFIHQPVSLTRDESIASRDQTHLSLNVVHACHILVSRIGS